jgi:GNAT superfamily N-acetyltransferase
VKTQTEAGEMKIEIIDLTYENLQDVPECCKYCLYWEFPEECVDSSKGKKQMFERKLGWLRETSQTFGNCGKLANLDSRYVGYAQYAPAAFLPNSGEYPAGPPSEDAVLISCLFIPDKENQRLGVGSQLLKGIIDDLKDRDIKAVETFARKLSPNNPSGPLEFYLANGFKIARDDAEFPLVRLEL